MHKDFGGQNPDVRAGGGGYRYRCSNPAEIDGWQTKWERGGVVPEPYRQERLPPEDRKQGRGGSAEVRRAEQGGEGDAGGCGVRRRHLPPGRPWRYPAGHPQQPDQSFGGHHCGVSKDRARRR
ncbi:hypothetical protein GA029_27125, partial [Bacteroides thetaiotaomicron]